MICRSRGAGLQIPSEGTPDRCQLFWGLSFLSPWLIQDVVHLSSTLGRMEVALLRQAGMSLGHPRRCSYSRKEGTSLRFRIVALKIAVNHM